MSLIPHLEFYVGILWWILYFGDLQFHHSWREKLVYLAFVLNHLRIQLILKSTFDPWIFSCSPCSSCHFRHSFQLSYHSIQKYHSIMLFFGSWSSLLFCPLQDGQGFVKMNAQVDLSLWGWMIFYLIDILKDRPTISSFFHKTNYRCL